MRKTLKMMTVQSETCRMDDKGRISSCEDGLGGMGCCGVGDGMICGAMGGCMGCGSVKGKVRGCSVEGQRAFRGMGC